MSIWYVFIHFKVVKGWFTVYVALPSCNTGITHKAAEEIGCLARFDLNLHSNRFELFWITKSFPYLVQSLLAYLHCFSAVCATKLPSLS